MRRCCDPLLSITPLVVALAAAACGARTAPAGAASGRVSHVSGGPAAPVVASNILREDYAGSAACGACHGDVVAAWRRSPMHRMTRLPDGDAASPTSEGAIRAPFDGRSFRFKGDVARMEQANGARFVRLRSAASAASGASAATDRLYRVTKVIGGRVREDFAGVEVASTAPAAPIIGDARAELILPVSYVFATQSFRLKGYSVMVGERPGLRAGGVWNQTCIFCHNTVPYFDDLWAALHGPGAPSYQGEVVDRVLPPERRLRYRATDSAALLHALGDEVRVLAGEGAARGVFSGEGPDAVREALATAMREARARFEPRHFIELGIGCEACHGGSRAHVDDPRLLPTFEPRAPFLATTAADGGRSSPSAAEWQNRACARCHQVLFSRYAHTWEGGSRRSASDAGGSHITSGEARDFLLGGCGRAMTCSTCHDPHGGGTPDRLARLATPAGNGVCTGCHRELVTPVALRAHAHHDPAGAAGSCVACHMPRKNMGLGYTLTRYHRIGSPTDATRVERDRPLECALCHANKTVGAVLDDINRLWGKRYDRTRVAALYGSLEANVLTATVERGRAHEQAAAMGAAAEQRWRPATAAVARQAATNAYPLVRYYATAALAAIEGRPLPADIHGEAGGGLDVDPMGRSPSSSGAAVPDEDRSTP